VSYTPSTLITSSTRRDVAEQAATRGRVLLSLNPFMANNPDALLAASSSITDVDELIDFGVASYGMAVGNNMAAELQGMDDARQRAVFSRLTRNQQMALQSLGYQAPERGASWWEQGIAGIADIARVPLRGVAEIGVGDYDIGHGVSKSLEGLAWLGGQPAHLYRTIRLQDDTSQWAGLLGFAVGAAAVAASPFTGGASLTALGLVAGGGLLGAGAASLATSSIINPGDWFRAWNDSWDGERTFDRAARAKADELLGDPRLVGLATDLAELEGLSLDDLAVEIAGLRDASDSNQLGVLNELAKRMGAEGTPEYQQAFQAMLNVLNVPQFREAVQTLQNGKMSPGRDFADMIPGLDTGSGLYNIISGSIDLGFTVAVDPLLLAGTATKAFRAARHGVRMAEGATLRQVLTNRFADPRVTELHSRVVDAINGVRLNAETGVEVARTGIVNSAALRSIGGSYKRIAPELLDWMDAQQIARGKLSVEQFQEFLTGSGDVAPLLRGTGGVQVGQRIIVEDWAPMRGAYRQLAQRVRATVQGMSDVALEERYTKAVLAAAGEQPEMLKLLPATAQEYVSDVGMIETPWLYQQTADAAYLAGRRVGQVMPNWLPLSRVIETLTTMSPAGKAIRLVGEDAFRDVLAMTETGQFMGMPSWVRRAWADAILTSTSTNVRTNLALGWLDNALTLAGGRSSDRLAEIVDEYLTKSRQIYGWDDSMMVNGRMRNVGMLSSQQADELLMPDLKELRRYAMRGNIARFMGIADLDIAEAAINRVWKPAVLLRLAFIPRAVGEEGLAFLLRGGMGGLVQDFGARSIADMRVYDTAVEKYRAGLSATMTEGEKQVFMRGPWARLPKHVRGLMWTMDKVGWGDPTFEMLNRYGSFVRGALERGVGLDVQKAAATTIPRAKAATSHIRTPLRMNLDETREAILLGKKYSWRRMVFGGVDSDAVDAAVAFRSKFQTQMMRSLSATSAVEFGTVDDPRYIEVREIEGKAKGKPKRVEYVRVNGERAITQAGELEHNTAVLRRMAELTEDPVVAQALAQVFVRIKGSAITIDDVEVLNVLKALRTSSPTVRTIAYEFLNNFQKDTWEGMLRYLSGRHPELASSLALLGKETDVHTFEEAVQLVEGVARNARGQLTAAVDADLAGEAAAAARVDPEAVVPEEPAWLTEARRRRGMTRDQLEQERIDRMAREQGDPMDYWDGYYDDVDAMQGAGMEPWQDHLERERLAREMEIDQADYFDDGSVDPWDGWFYDERGLPVDPAHPNASPEYARRLRDRLDEMADYEMQEAIIHWSVADADVKAFRGELLAQADADVQIFEDELVRLGGSIDPRNGRVVFHIHPSSATGGEWDWWQQLDPRMRRGYAQRFLRRHGGRPATSIDVLASEAGLTVDEWAERWQRSVRQYESARRARSGYKKMPLYQLREEFRAAELEQLARSRPDVDVDAVTTELASIEASLNDPRRQAMLDAFRRQQRTRDVVRDTTEPERIVLPETAADRRLNDQLRRESMADDANYREDERDFSVDDPNPPDPRARRQAFEEERRRVENAAVEQRLPPDDTWWMDEPALVEPKLYQVDLDPETMEGFARSLRQMAPTMQMLAGLDDETRGWIAALVRTMDRPGSGVQLSLLESRLAAGQPLWYSSIDDAREDLVSALRSGVMNPHYNDGVQRSLRAGDEVRAAQVRLHALPSFRGPARALQQRGTALTYETILELAQDKSIIAANRDIVQALLANPSARTFRVTADSRLARELNAIDGQMKSGYRTVGDTRSVLMPRDVLDGRVWDEGAVVPLAKRLERGEQQTMLWELDSETFRHRLQATPKDLTEKAQAWAEQEASEIQHWFGKHSQAGKVPRMRRLDDGTEEPFLYRVDADGELRPVTSNDVLSDQRDQFVDYRGRPVDMHSTNYFDDVEAGPSGQDPAWAALGGLFEDMQDSRIAGVRMVQKREAKFASGQLIPSVDSVRVYRARPEHIERLGDAKVPIAWTEKVEPRFSNAWDRFVRYGFDKVIGGSIDAILRRPMAFHYFKQRYVANRDLMRWVIDPTLERKTETIRDQIESLSGVTANAAGVAAGARRLAIGEGNELAAQWNDADALAWLRGHTETDMADLLARGVDRARINGDVAAAREIDELVGLGPRQLRATFAPGTSAQGFLKVIESQMPAGLLDRPAELFSAKGRKLMQDNPVLQHFTDEDWEVIQALHKNLAHLSESASEAAAIAAVNDMVPFIDSHEFKTQFAEFGQGFLPFWYAEENFLKRWVRGLAMEGPAYIRKAQLGYMGLKQAGVIRTDSSGKDWFVYPGSTLLADTISKVSPKLGLATQGIMFQTPTDALLPGLNQRYGTPSFNPLVTVPVEFLGMLDPSFKPLERALTGTVAGDTGITEQIIPTQLTRFWNAFTGDEKSSQKHASAMMAAITQMEANGLGLPDNATVAQREEYLERVREHARIIVFAQAMLGFIVPGAPSTLTAAPDAGFLGIGVEDPADVLNAEYVELVRGIGIEAGTNEFLRRYPESTLHNVLAYTQSRSETRSGARIGVTTPAVEWYDQNQDYIANLPYAGPWLLPQEYLGQGPLAETAYDQATSLALRTRLTPEEFLLNIKFKEGATRYFYEQQRFDDAIAVAEGSGDVERVAKLKNRWTEWSTMYRAAHPMFDEELTSGASQERRRKILDEMRVAVNDPLAPASSRVAELRSVMSLFDRYRARLALMSEDRSAAGRVKVEQLKTRYTGAMQQLVDRTPTLRSFWISVLRPESSLD
jgi:hypothetical protein